MTAADYTWKATNDERVRPEHAGLRSGEPPLRPATETERAEEQRAAWFARVRALRLFKRSKRLGRTTAPGWDRPPRCVVRELQHDSDAVARLRSGCRCPACCTRAATHHQLRGPNRDLTRGPRRLTRAQRKLRHKAQP